MRFEARALKPHAEPVDPQRLVVGVVYFSVTFVDEEMLCPALEPLVFVGVDLDPGDENRLYFQDPDSYRRGVRYPAVPTDGGATIFSAHRDYARNIFEYERALDCLLVCALRRGRTS